METIGEALEACADDEVDTAFEGPYAARGIGVNAMLWNDDEQDANEQDAEQDGLGNVGNQRTAHASLAAVGNGDEGHQQRCEYERRGAGVAIVGTDDRRVGPHLVEQAHENRGREAECRRDAVMLGQEADHAFCAELSAQAIECPSGERDAEPVHRIADATDDTEVRSHVGGVGH